MSKAKRVVRFEDGDVALNECYETACKKPKWANYSDYLASAEWHKIRDAVMKRDDSGCRLCGEGASEVHHHKYPKNWDNDDKENCIAVCDECHRRAHGLAGKVDAEAGQGWQSFLGVRWRNDGGIIIDGLCVTDGARVEIVLATSQVGWLVEQLLRVSAKHGRERGYTIKNIADMITTLRADIADKQSDGNLFGGAI